MNSSYKVTKDETVRSITILKLDDRSAFLDDDEAEHAALAILEDEGSARDWELDEVKRDNYDRCTVTFMRI